LEKIYLKKEKNQALATLLLLGSGLIGIGRKTFARWHVWTLKGQENKGETGRKGKLKTLNFWILGLIW